LQSRSDEHATLSLSLNSQDPDHVHLSLDMWVSDAVAYE
jgi:hypothetical protein